MARSPDLTLSDIAGGILGSDPANAAGRGNHRNEKNIGQIILDKIGKSSPTKSLIVGTISGWVTGLCAMKIGKVAAFGLGGGIILLHLANESGYVDIHWDRISDSTSRYSDLIEKISEFVRNNSYYSAGFAGVRKLPSPNITDLTQAEDEERPTVVAPPVDSTTPAPTNDLDSLRPAEDNNSFLDKASFLATTKPLSHSPKISPSSIPNPSPSVTTMKQLESGYPNYGGYLYSIPGYSAFQPVGYQAVGMAPNPPPIVKSPVVQTEVKSSVDFAQFTTATAKEAVIENNTNFLQITSDADGIKQSAEETQKAQMDFEEQFVPEIVPAAVTDSSKATVPETTMSITSLVQGSGATITIPSREPVTTNNNFDMPKKKQPERFSLKTSIPISKIDMKCVTNSADASLQTNLGKKINVTFKSSCAQPKPSEANQRVEIHSNIVIRTAQSQDIEMKEKEPAKQQHSPNENIATLINAAEAINKSDPTFWKNEKISEQINVDDNIAPQNLPSTCTNSVKSPICVPSKQITNTELINKVSTLSSKPPDISYAEQKNQIVFIQNKSSSSPKMLLTISQSQPTGQAVVQRSNIESKNFQPSSRPSSINTKSSDASNAASNKVVALKRLHHDNVDENDFENLITENQIYGNKIVVKEKSHGTLQEQDIKSKPFQNKNLPEKINHQGADTKNVVIQPNFLYLSNVQFPANLMMIKNNTKINQTESMKNINKNVSNENITQNEITSNTFVDTINVNATLKNIKGPTMAVSKEIHVLKSSNNVLQSLTKQNISKTTDVVFPTNQKVIMNSQIVYQVPMIVDGEVQKMTTPAFVSRDYPKLINQTINNNKTCSEPTKSNEKLFIACPYQMDAMLQPKIVITNIRSKMTKIEEMSSLDLYEKRRRLRRLKHLSNRDVKDSQKNDSVKKVADKLDNAKNIITPDRMEKEIYKEFASTKSDFENVDSDSESDYGGEEVKEYESIIDEYREDTIEEINKKSNFLSSLKLATRDVYKEKELQRQERMLRYDSVAAAYIAVGRLDRTNMLPTIDCKPENRKRSQENRMSAASNTNDFEGSSNNQQKSRFLSHLQLTYVSPQFKKDFEHVWVEIVKDKRRRNGVEDIHNKNMCYESSRNKGTDKLDIDTEGQMQMLTDIKKYVNENNNLIKKRLDVCLNKSEMDRSIHALAERNLSELTRLSKLADRSVKLHNCQDANKRDLNPGFDSENIEQVPTNQGHIRINIPSISKIIALKTCEDPAIVNTSQATSMDEPSNSAAGVKEGDAYCQTSLQTDKRGVDVSCQSDEVSVFAWPGIEAVMKSYTDFDKARIKEKAELKRRNIQLSAARSKANRTAIRDGEYTRILLAERSSSQTKENSLRASLQRIISIVELIRNYE